MASAKHSKETRRVKGKSCGMQAVCAHRSRAGLARALGFCGLRLGRCCGLRSTICTAQRKRGEVSTTDDGTNGWRQSESVMRAGRNKKKRDEQLQIRWPNGSMKKEKEKSHNADKYNLEYKRTKRF